MIQFKRRSEDLFSTEPVLFSRRGLWKLIFPLMIEQTLTALMGVADTLMVSAVGEASISGVTCVDQVNSLILFVFESFSVGGGVLCAQYVGRRDRDAVRCVVRQLMTLVPVVAVAVTALCAAFASPLLKLLYASMEADVFAEALIYFRITLLSCPFLALYTAGAALYRACGEPKLPVAVIGVGNVLNIIGNAILIFGFHMGAEGAAWSTLFSRVFSCAALLILQARPGSDISLQGIGGVRLSRRETLRIVKIGLPTALENGMFQLGKVLMQAIVVTLGTSVIAAQSMLTQFETLSSRPSMAVRVALLTVAGQYIGAGRPDLARRFTDYFMDLARICCLLTGLLCLAITRPLCSLTALTPEATDMVFEVMAFLAVVKVILWPPSFMLMYTLKAAGDVKVPMWISIGSMWIFRVGGALILPRVFHLGLWGVWLAWVCDWIVRSILYTSRYRQGKWEKIRL